MSYPKEHFKYIDKSKRILEAGSIDSWEAALDGSQGEAFDYIVASYVIEYVPDVIEFFADVQNVLAENGKLYLTISNKAYSADCYRQPTTFAEIYDIHKRGVKNNPIRAFDYLLTVAPDNVLLTDTAAFDLALQIYEQLQNSEEQAGVSLNVFTPESFLLILYCAFKLRIFPFRVLFFAAPPESPDFDVVLERSESVLETEAANAEAEYVLAALKDVKNIKPPNIRAENVENSSLGSNILKIFHSDFKFPFYIRNNTSDVAVYNAIIVNCEYAFIEEKNVKVIVDAGANIGFASIYFAKIFPNAKIIAIEPERTNFALLEENTKNYPNIIRLNRALWNEDCEINLMDAGLDNWGFMTLDNQSHNNITTPKLQKCHTVKTVTIESILKDYGFNAIDILKIDIEGAEKEVLSNCQHWIGNVNSLIIELHERMKSGCEEAFDNMKNNFNYISQHGEDFYLRKIKSPEIKFEEPKMKYQKVKGLVSIIVPIYNTEIFLRECLDSVLKQTFANWEAILVIDGSTDGCLAICKEYAARDSRFKVVHKKDNEGLLLARKTGLENSSGEYIANLDSDDSYKPEFLEKMYAKIIETNADFVWCLKDNPPYQNYDWSSDKLANINHIFSFLPGYFQCYVWNKLIKRDIYERILFPQIYLVFGEDVFQMIQIAYHSKYAARVLEHLYNYTVGSSSSSLNNEKSLVSKILAPFAWIKVMKILFGNTFQINKYINANCNNAIIYYNELSQEARIKHGIEGIIYTEEFTRTSSP